VKRRPRLSWFRRLGLALAAVAFLGQGLAFALHVPGWAQAAEAAEMCRVIDHPPPDGGTAADRTLQVCLVCQVYGAFGQGLVAPEVGFRLAVPPEDFLPVAAAANAERSVFLAARPRAPPAVL
jgi:hypothetical protein